MTSSRIHLYSNLAILQGLQERIKEEQLRIEEIRNRGRVLVEATTQNPSELSRIAPALNSLAETQRKVAFLDREIQNKIDVITNAWHLQVFPDGVRTLRDKMAWAKKISLDRVSASTFENTIGDVHKLVLTCTRLTEDLASLRPEDADATLLRGRPGWARYREPSNLRAMSRWYHPRMVSGLAVRASLNEAEPDRFHCRLEFAPEPSLSP